MNGHSIEYYQACGGSFLRGRWAERAHLPYLNICNYINKSGTVYTVT